MKRTERKRRSESASSRHQRSSRRRSPRPATLPLPTIPCVMNPVSCCALGAPDDPGEGGGVPGAGGSSSQMLVAPVDEMAGDTGSTSTKSSRMAPVLLPALPLPEPEPDPELGPSCWPGKPAGAEQTQNRKEGERQSVSGSQSAWRSQLQQRWVRRPKTCKASRSLTGRDAETEQTVRGRGAVDVAAVVPRAASLVDAELAGVALQAARRRHVHALPVQALLRRQRAGNIADAQTLGAGRGSGTDGGARRARGYCG